MHWSSACRYVFGSASMKMKTGLMLVRVPVRDTLLKNPVLLFPRREHVTAVVVVVAVAINLTLSERRIRRAVDVTASRLLNEMAAACTDTVGFESRICLGNGCRKSKTIPVVCISDALLEISLLFPRCEYIISVIGIVVAAGVFFSVFSVFDFAFSIGGFRQFVDVAVSRPARSVGPRRDSFARL